MQTSDNNEEEPSRLSNGRSREEHARRQRLFKVLFKARFIEDAAKSGEELRDRQLVDWVVGDWYLAVHCRSCGAQFPFSREDDVSEAFYFTNSHQIVLTCMECKFPLPYVPEQIKRVQAQ